MRAGETINITINLTNLVGKWITGASAEQNVGFAEIKLLRLQLDYIEKNC